MTLSRSLVLLGLSSLALTSGHSADDTRAWITQSNAHAQILVDTLFKTSPEKAGRMGGRRKLARAFGSTVAQSHSA